jgi:TolB protein
MQSLLFAVDARMEIIKNKSTLPKIVVSVSSDTQNIANNYDKFIVSLVKKDLQVSGHFENIEFDITNHFDQIPQYDILRAQNADLYLLLQVQNEENQGLKVNMKLYDINSNSIVLHRSYRTSAAVRYPFLSHKIAIDVNKYLQAPSIKWMDRFVIFARYLDSKTSEIVVSDYTLTYQKVVVKGGLNIFPKWANKEQTDFYYTTYNYMRPTVMKQNLFTSKSEKIITSDGMAVCSDVSSDGTKLALTLAPDSQPDIYVYNTVTKLKTKITSYNGIDVGGSFIENDSKIVFISDRLRYPNVFAKTIGQRGVERLVYHGKNNSQASTYKDYIVYASRETDNEFAQNAFNLYLISTYSDYARRLTTNGRNQFPKFSSNGESILFIKNDNGVSSL